MQIIVMLVFLAVWLLILWIGSIALETTGLERAKARFQALSALTGTGFTTSEAESIVEHPKRRKIATYLIFIGNAGIIAFIILLVLYVRAGLTAPSIFIITITIAVLLFIGLSFWLGLVDKVTNAILSLLGKGWGGSRSTAERILYRYDDYAVFQLSIGRQAKIAGLKLKDAGLQERDITVLAIERGDKVLSYPQPDEMLLAGDQLLGYGRQSEISSLTLEKAS